MYIIYNLYCIIFQIPLGVLPKNEMKSGDIMKFHHQYVPVIKYQQKINSSVITEESLDDAVMYPILFGGDQLTIARQRTAIKAKSNAPTPVIRLDGLIPTIEDWHAKLTFLEVNSILYNYTYIL